MKYNTLSRLVKIWIYKLHFPEDVQWFIVAPGQRHCFGLGGKVKTSDPPGSVLTTRPIPVVPNNFFCYIGPHLTSQISGDPI